MSASFSCVPPLNLCSSVNYTNPEVPSQIAIASSTVSCLGSIAIIISYIAVKEFRTNAQTIIMLLAIADLFTSFGYIVGSVNFLTHWDKNVTSTADCHTFNVMCQAQSYLTTWSSICSQAWTCLLAAYLLLVTLRPTKLGVRALVLSNVLVWGLPLVPVSVLVGKQHLGYSTMSAAGWCFIGDHTANESMGLVTFLTLVGGKFTEIFTYIFVIVAYVITLYHMCKVRGCNQTCVEMRLLIIPAVYLALRIWGTTHFFYTLGLFHQCIDADSITAVKILRIFQAIGDPGQGWANAILYILLSSVYRRKLIYTPLIALASYLVAIATRTLQGCVKFSLNINSGGRIVTEQTPLLEP
ncbi:hypothetical protein EMCRGX_G016562 [Ephydatia muelleri]